VDYERALSALASDRRSGSLSREDRERVLYRLVEEELLVQRGMELGLASRDRRVRTGLSAAVLEVVSARAEAAPPASEAELRRFYQIHGDLFRRAPRVRIEHAFFDVNAAGEEDARARARRAVSAASLSGLGDPAPLPVPGGWLPASQITHLLGPTTARGVAELPEGRSGGPWRGVGGYSVVRVLERRPGFLPPFEQIVTTVRAEQRRRASDAALRRFLEESRRDATVRVGTLP